MTTILASWQCFRDASLSSLVAPDVVIATTSGAASDEKFGIMTTVAFQIVLTSPPYLPPREPL